MTTDPAGQVPDPQDLIFATLCPSHRKVTVDVRSTVLTWTAPGSPRGQWVGRTLGACGCVVVLADVPTSIVEVLHAAGAWVGDVSPDSRLESGDPLTAPSAPSTPQVQQPARVVRAPRQHHAADPAALTQADVDAFVEQLADRSRLVAYLRSEQRRAGGAA